MKRPAPATCSSARFSSHATTCSRSLRGAGSGSARARRGGNRTLNGCAVSRAPTPCLPPTIGSCLASTARCSSTGSVVAMSWVGETSSAAKRPTDRSSDHNTPAAFSAATGVRPPAATDRETPGVSAVRAGRQRIRPGAAGAKSAHVLGPFASSIAPPPLSLDPRSSRRA